MKRAAKHFRVRVGENVERITVTPGGIEARSDILGVRSSSWAKVLGVLLLHGVQHELTQGDGGRTPAKIRVAFHSGVRGLDTADWDVIVSGGGIEAMAVGYPFREGYVKAPWRIIMGLLSTSVAERKALHA